MTGHSPVYSTVVEKYLSKIPTKEVVELSLVLVGQVKWSTAKGQLISEEFFVQLANDFFTDFLALLTL